MKRALAHVLWIGGATDSGKTTIAQLLAEWYELPVYNYDRYDFAHHYHLAQTLPAYRKMLNASPDENWILPTPKELMERTLRSFRDRMSLVIGDLRSLPRQSAIIAEGFGLIPELVMPLLTDPGQALWLVPSPAFKQASMERRNKPSFRDATRDPELARRNVYERDMLLAAYIKGDALSRGLIVYEVDGSQPAETMAHLVEHHFISWLS
jgi:adenylate kinase family enzyme